MITDLGDHRLDGLSEPLRAALAEFAALSQRLSAQGLSVALLVGQRDGQPPFPTVVEGDPALLHAMVVNLLAQLPLMQAQERGEAPPPLAAPTALDLELICRARGVEATLLLTDAPNAEQGKTALHLPTDVGTRSVHLRLLSRLLQAATCQCETCRAARQEDLSPTRTVN